MATTDADRARESVYRRYLQLCNEHQFERLGEFVDEEFAVYRVDAGKIVEVWVAADNLHLLSQLR